MFALLTRPHWQSIALELRYPSTPDEIVSTYKPKFDFGPLPPALDSERWSRQDFISRGFPFRDLPESTPTVFRRSNWDKLVARLLQESLLDDGWLSPLRTVRTWLQHGTPVYLQHPGTLCTESPHHIQPDQVAVALDSLARFNLM